MADNNEYSKAEIRREYEESAKYPENHRKVRWGSRASMLNRFKQVIEQIDFDSIENWLDVGCGPGDFQEMVSRKVKSDFQCLAIDLSESLIKVAAAAVSDPRIKFEVCDFIDIENSSFDLITSIGVLQKTNLNLEKFFKHAVSLLKPDGVLWVDTKHRDWEKFKEPDFDPEPTHRWFSINQLEQAAEEAGLKFDKMLGFLPRNNKIVKPEESHTILMVASRRT